MDNKKFKIESVEVPVTGKVAGKKVVEPYDVTFNQQKGTLNVYLNKNDIISMNESFLHKHVGVDLNRRPGGGVSEKQVKDSLEKSKITLRCTGETQEKRFFRAGSVKANLNRNSLDMYLDKEHICQISNERLRSLGLEMEFTTKRVALER
ncbi:MAG: hypothetical protein H6624_16835 [Bdellovibrionaceae bacterium]|nr:hypothetical protein [Bdellovibrionales bacterium]MCB9086012.1 hypothetical protein [Pseudobdellovibrionaceae bacterium]